MNNLSRAVLSSAGSWARNKHAVIGASVVLICGKTMANMLSCYCFLWLLHIYCPFVL